ncbi:hypothetical protein TNCT_162481 [Trichonephila clavata]|uniref:Uncharacterized protein n=1 Tax=Trichonephila clavata TaxID=2740835 RepID=A0A8X6F0B1_TRICU|nr:hypothetical protein TNCT_162481 [Trichonephila clavata]
MTRLSLKLQREDFSIIANDASKNKQITSIAGKMEHRLSDIKHRLLDMKHRLLDLKKLFKRYENMKEDGNVDLHANKIITKKKGIKRRAVCQPVGGSPNKRPSSPPSPSIPEPSFPVPVATRAASPSELSVSNTLKQRSRTFPNQGN